MKLKFMNYVLAGVLSISTLPVLAVDAVASAPLDCNVQKAQASANRNNIKQAFARGDGCTAGKLEVQNHAYIQSNLACFPNFKKDDYNLFHVMDKIDSRVESVPAGCSKPNGKVMVNHQKVKQALIKGDGCTAGKLQLETRRIVYDNQKCFVGYEKEVFRPFEAADKINDSKPE